VLFYRVSQDELPLPSLQRAAGELAWLGQDTPELWARVGQELERAGRPQEALAAYRRSVRIGHAPSPWLANRMAWLLLEQDEPGPRALHRAGQLAEYLVERLGDSRPEGHQTLAEVRARQGRWSEAIEAADRALEVARLGGDTKRARHIQRQIEDYRRRETAQPAERPALPRTSAANRGG